MYRRLVVSTTQTAKHVNNYRGAIAPSLFQEIEQMTVKLIASNLLELWQCLEAEVRVLTTIDGHSKSILAGFYNATALKDSVFSKRIETSVGKDLAEVFVADLLLNTISIANINNVNILTALPAVEGLEEPTIYELANIFKSRFTKLVSDENLLPSLINKIDGNYRYIVTEHINADVRPANIKSGAILELISLVLILTSVLEIENLESIFVSAINRFYGNSTVVNRKCREYLNQLTG